MAFYFSRAVHAFNPASGSRLPGNSAKPERSFFFGSFLLSLAEPPDGAPQAAMAISVLLERNPPNCPLAPFGPPALLRESNPAPQNQKRNYMPAKTAQPVPQSKNAANGPKLPVKTFRLGRIKATVWENEADQKKFFNVTFARTYMDDARNFHDTDSFGRDDLPLVAKLADQAHTFIFERIAELKTEQSE
jgi:hypothetical protein